MSRESRTDMRVSGLARLRLVADRARQAGLLSVAVLVVSAGMASSAAAAPIWDVKQLWGPTNLQPGGEGQFEIFVRNLGDSTSAGPITATVDLPPAVEMTGIGDTLGWSCEGTSSITCTYGASVQQRLPIHGLFNAHYAQPLRIDVAVAPGAPPGAHQVVSAVSGGEAAEPASDSDPVSISPGPTGYGVIPDSVEGDLFRGQYPAGAPVRQSGEHPFEMRINFDFNLESFDDASSGRRALHPVERVRTVESILPRGVIGNPEATPKCKLRDFFTNTGPTTTGCPPETQVGTIDVDLTFEGQQFFTPSFLKRVAVYNLEPPRGHAADFGFTILDYRGHIYPTLDPANEYRIKGLSAYISSVLQVRSVNLTFWGVPADPVHDHLRADPNTFGGYGASSTAPIKPFLTLPAQCGDQAEEDRFLTSTESWSTPGTFESTPEVPASFEIEGCDDPRIRFEPEISLQPTSRAAGGPTGLKAELKVPQRNDTVQDTDELYEQNGDIQAIPTPPLKKAVVTFPEGMTLSTSAAQGLGNCTAEQIGLGNDNPVTCPSDSQFGLLTLNTPLLPADEPMRGQIFIANQNDNPFNDFLAMYFMIEDPSRGLRVKLPAHVQLDPATGQITTTFDDLPQFPVSSMELAFKGGVRAALVNPTTCGEKTIRTDFYSWHDPDTPITTTNSYDVTARPDGSPCVNHLRERPFRPQLSAGTVSPSAGTYSPFIFRLQRTDDDQEFSQLGTTLPPGLLANISNVTECPEAGIAQAEAAGRTGTVEKLFPSCPGSSLIGSTDVGSGVGQVITYLPGKAYLAGPYRGGPLSLLVITPVVAGPYDLGVIAVRSAIRVNRETAQVNIQADPFPQIFEGIPVRIRDIRVKADRPQTMINPTSCEPTSVGARVTGTGGDLRSTADDTVAQLSNRFQVANCASLPFRPKLTFRLRGRMRRGAFPALTAHLKGRPGDANIARTTVVLPKSTFIEQGHIRTICTRVQFAVDQCPPGSIYGKASARSPLFNEVLAGPVYLRSNGGERLLPDLVVKLEGKIEVVLAGFVDSVRERVRNSFNVIPDAPVTNFSLRMQGGKRGLLVNSRHLCRAPSRANMRLVGHNGKVLKRRTKVRVNCKRKRRAKRSRHSR